MNTVRVALAEDNVLHLSAATIRTLWDARACGAFTSV